MPKIERRLLITMGAATALVACSGISYAHPVERRMQRVKYIYSTANGTNDYVFVDCWLVSSPKLLYTLTIPVDDQSNLVEYVTSLECDPRLVASRVITELEHELKKSGLSSVTMSWMHHYFNSTNSPTHRGLVSRPGLSFVGDVVSMECFNGQ